MMLQPRAFRIHILPSPQDDAQSAVSLVAEKDVGHLAEALLPRRVPFRS